MLTATRKITKVLPTTRSSVSEGLFLTLVQMSMVKMVEEELKMEVREDMRAAIITASIRPRAPVSTNSLNTDHRRKKQIAISLFVSTINSQQ